MTGQKNINLINQLLNFTVSQTKNFIIDFLTDKNYKITEGLYGIMAKGNIPIVLIAHCDTVFDFTQKTISYDQKTNSFHSDNGLGADDRAGVFAILKIISDGFRPHVIFTFDEETDNMGIAWVSQFVNPFGPIKYAIEFDRQGNNECVFYECDNQKFMNFIEDFGFHTEFGTFTDISVLCPVWDIAGVNLSVGYFNEHTHNETLFIEFLYSTINRVEMMLSNINQSPYFKYHQGVI